MRNEDVRVVVVENHEDTRNILQILLEKDGYHVRIARDGLKAAESNYRVKIDENETELPPSLPPPCSADLIV